MKHTPKSSIRTVASSREALALATLFSLAHASAAETPAKKEDTAKKDKKKGDESSDVMPEINVQAARESTYKTEALTSQKYTVPLRDVPQTVTVVPRQIIEEQNATTLTEILRNVPGITMAGGENGNGGTVAGDTFLMRGFDATNSLFVDGVRDNGTQSRDTFNTETAEIFLGPTGSDVGRGNAAGYVNQVTKAPHLGNTYLGSAQYASGDRQRYTADVNQEIPQLSGTAIRLNAVLQDGGVAGRDYVERNVFGIAPSVAFGLGTDVTTVLSYQHVEQHNLPDYGVPANRNKVPTGIDPDDFFGTTSDYEDITQDTFTARVDWKINEDFSLRNQTRYNETTRESMGVRPAYSLTPGATYGRVTRSLVAGDRDNDIFSNQTTLTYKLKTGEVKQTFVGALEYTDEEQDSYTLAGAGTFANPFFPGQDFSHNTPPNFRHYQRDPHAVAHGEAQTIGLSLFDTIEIGKKWIVSGGIRMDSYDASYHSIATTGIRTPNPVTTGEHDFTTSDEVYSSKIGVTYKPIETGSIYAAYSRTVQPPGTGNFTLNETATSSASVNSDPQESENFEIGTKWDFFDSKLSFTAATFYTENTNFIYLEDAGPPAVYSADGGQKIRGVTVGANGQITENWAILGSLTFLHGEIDQSGNVIDGNRLSRTPDMAGTLWTTYKLPKGFTVGLGFRFQDSVNTSTVDNSPTMDGFGVFDGFAQYDVNEHFNLRLNVSNLLDKKYIASTSGGGGGDTGGTGGTTGGGTDVSGNRVLYGAPISFALTANYKF